MGIFLGGRGRLLDHLGERGDEHLGDVTEGDSDGEDEKKEEEGVERQQVLAARPWHTRSWSHAVFL
jgi:hypothetical protein